LSLPFFASRIRLGESGVAQIYPLGNLSEFEKSGLARLAPQLRAEIAKGVEFANKTRTL
jgi:malate dehydrogenase